MVKNCALSPDPELNLCMFHALTEVDDSWYNCSAEEKANTRTEKSMTNFIEQFYYGMKLKVESDYMDNFVTTLENKNIRYGLGSGEFIDVDGKTYWVAAD